MMVAMSHPEAIQRLAADRRQRKRGRRVVPAGIGRRERTPATSILVLEDRRVRSYSLELRNCVDGTDRGWHPEGALMAGIPVIDTGSEAGPANSRPWSGRPMTIDEFYAFIDTRPDYEKWELIEGEPVLNASPSPLHQWIAFNVAVALKNREREIKAPWVAMLPLGVRVSDKDRPEPDVLVYPAERRRPDTRRDRDDVLVVFEVLSPSTEKRDLGWKRKAYPRLPSLTHYIAISQDAVDVMVFARDDGFEGRRFQPLDEAIDLPSLGISLPVAEIYRDTGLTDGAGLTA
jgi:Uma2 family endonuclease